MYETYKIRGFLVYDNSMETLRGVLCVNQRGNIRGNIEGIISDKITHSDIELSEEQTTLTFSAGLEYFLKKEFGGKDLSGSYKGKWESEKHKKHHPNNDEHSVEIILTKVS